MGGLIRLSRHTANDVYSILKEEILSLHFKPGQIISENEIASRFNISRTPVHSAFVQLKNDKLLNVIPQKGTVVSQMDWDFIQQIAYMRVQVESAIYVDVAYSWDDALTVELEQNLRHQQELVAEDEDPRDFYTYSSEYHKIYYTFVGKSKLWEAIENIQFDYARYRRLFYSDKEHRMKAFIEHENLYHLIRERNASGILRLVLHHLREENGKPSPKIEQYKDYFLAEHYQ